MAVKRRTKLRFWKTINIILTIFWVLMVPLSLYMGWIESIVFVSAVSIYANAVSHLAAWRADD